MAQPVTFAELKVAVRELADEESSSGGASSLISEPELESRINEAVRGYYRLLVEVQGHEYFGKDHTYTLVPEQRRYRLPLDFWQAIRVTLQYDEWFSEIYTWSQQDTARHENRGSNSVGQLYWAWFSEYLRYRLQGPDIELIPPPREQRYRLHLRYTPVTPKLVHDTDTIDGVNGFEDWIKYKAAILLGIKSETPSGDLRTELAVIDADIRTHAPNRDAGRAERVQDTRRDDWSGIGYLDEGSGPWGSDRGWPF